MTTRWIHVSGLCVLLAMGCGGSTPEPEAPESEAAESSEAPEEATEEAAEEGGDEVAAEESEPESEPEPEPERKLSPKDVISSQGVMFSFSFKKSEAYEAADKRCTEKSGDDPAKRAKCMSKEHEKFQADSIAFRKDKDGVWWWTTIRRRGKSITALHKIEFDWGEETDDTITIKPKGPDKGSKPMRVPRELVIQVPDDSGIAIDDPKHGRMYYEAKMGLIGENER